MGFLGSEDLFWELVDFFAELNDFSWEPYIFSGALRNFFCVERGVSHT